MALFQLLQKATTRWPAAALRSQSEGIITNFQFLEREAAATAAALEARGYRAGETLVSDLGNVSQNLVLQLACSRLGVCYGTAKNDKALAALRSAVDVRGAVYADAEGPLARGDLPGLDAAVLAADADRRFGDDAEAAAPESAAHAYFNSTSPLTNEHLEALAEDAASNLELTDADGACVSVTLCHAFGVGSAVGACLSRGATISLPNVDGIVGCGVPSERAAATLLCLQQDASTVLYADTHTLKALPADADLPALRTGVCKVSSGSTFLAQDAEFAGRSLWTLGKA